MYLTNRTPRALIGEFSVTTEAVMREKQALVYLVLLSQAEKDNF